MSNRARNFAIGAVLIGAAGYLAGILTAPKSGKDTRRDIREAKERAFDEAEQQLKRLGSELDDLLHEAEGTVRKSQHRLNEVLEGEVVPRAADVRRQVAKLLNDIKDGKVNERDLQKVVDEAAKAVKSVRKYLSK